MTKTLSIKGVDAELWKRIRVKAVETDTSAGEIINRALAAYLAQLDKPAESQQTPPSDD